MRKVLFVYLLVEERFGSGIEKHALRLSKGAPLGFEYLSSVLLKERYIYVEILDERIFPFTPASLLKKIKDEKFDLVGLYLCTEPELEKKAIHTIRILTAGSDVPIIAGGPTFATTPVLQAGCDIICNGEGEQTILQIIDFLENRIDKREVKGISYIEGGKEVRTSPQPLIENLDDIPFPIRDKRTVMKYNYIGNPNMRFPYISMIASRGCPMNCMFCNTADIWGKKLRFRSCNNVIGEIESLVREYGPCYLAFRDDIFGVKQNWLIEFCEKLIEKKLPVRWVCNQHPLIPRTDCEKVISLMAKAGCDTLHYGVQSADEEILKRINRNPVELDLLKDKLNAAKKAGILTFIDFIIGLPGETENSIKKNIEYTSKVRPGFVTYYSLEILPGTQLEKEYIQKNRQITSITNEQIDKWIRVCRRKYMLNPLTIISLLSYVLRHNPRWIFSALRVIPQAASMIGFGRKWKTN